MSSLVTAALRSVFGKITRSGLDTRRSRPPASTITASGAPMGPSSTAQGRLIAVRNYRTIMSGESVQLPGARRACPTDRSSRGAERSPAGGGGLTIVCLDEFQDLLVAATTLDGLFRSVIQHHGRAAAYVFAGSQPSLMRALFSDRERPFYGQARPLELPPLPVDEAAGDVEALLQADDLNAGSAVDELLAFSGGHPQRTLLLAHHLYDLLDRPGPPEDLAAAAVDLALAETRDAHQAVWDGLGRVERIVMLALADGQAPTGSRVAG